MSVVRCGAVKNVDTPTGVFVVGSNAVKDVDTLYRYVCGQVWRSKNVDTTTGISWLDLML